MKYIMLLITNPSNIFENCNINNIQFININSNEDKNPFKYFF